MNLQFTIDPSRCLALFLVLCAAAGVRATTAAAESLRPVCCTEQDVSILEQQTAQKWPKGVIPYQFSQQLSEDTRRRLLSTMGKRELDSCVIFTPRDTETDFVSFELGERCCSNIGYTGRGKQDVLLGTPCLESSSEKVLSDVIQLLVGERRKSTEGTPSAVQKRQVPVIEAYPSTLNQDCHDTCGGYSKLDPLTNQIERRLGTPQYPKPYQTHLDCVWKLDTPEGYALKLRFVGLDTENRCNHDFVRVQYLDQTGLVLRTRLLCGSPDLEELNKPSVHDYNVSAAVIHFHSDSSYGGEGLLLEYSLKERRVNETNPCSINNGGCVHVCISDVFGDHTCSCRPGYRLTKRGRCLDINECKTSNGGCGHKCTNTQGAFICDCKLGYRLGSDQRSCHSCDIFLNQTSGTIYSPGYPTSYPHNQNCRWSIHRWPDHHLKITVSNIDIPFSRKCTKDFLKLEPTNFPPQGRLCGHYNRIQYFVDKSTVIRHRARDISSHHHSGFVLTFTQVKSSGIDESDLEYVYVNDKNVLSRKKVWSLNL